MNDKHYEALGHVTIEHETTSLYADYIRFDHDTQKAFAKGNVFITQSDGDRLSCDEMDIDLNEEIGTLYGGKMFIDHTHLYINGNKIQKTGKNTYTIYKSRLTTCDGENPDWKITGNDLSLTVEGYGFVNHVAFWVKDIPIFYIPWMVFPIKTKRQTGLLLPKLGFSKRKGFTYNQPFFWAINDQADITFSANHMHTRGENIGVEYRHLFSRTSQLMLMADGFKDKKTDDGTEQRQNDWGYQDRGETHWPRTHTSRYWIRLKQDHELPYGLSSKLDIDWVSDQDYLREFKNTPNGFKDSNELFVNTFGRGIDDVDDTIRMNRWQVQHIWPQYNFNVQWIRYDDVIQRRLFDKDGSKYLLPEMHLAAIKHPLWNSPVYMDMYSQYIQVYQDSNTDHQGLRADIHPRLYVPLSLREYMTIEPSVGVRHTLWYVTRGSNSPLTQIDSSSERGLYDIKLDLASNVEKLYTLKNNNLIHHRICSLITYEYIPYENQNSYPVFISSKPDSDPSSIAIDRIDDKNRITYSMIHNFVKIPVMIDQHQSIRQIARLKIEQPYQFDENISYDEDDWNTQDDSFLPLNTELYLFPQDTIQFRANTYWSHQQQRWVSNELSLDILTPYPILDKFGVSYTYHQNSNQSISMRSSSEIFFRTHAAIDYEYNFISNTQIKFSADIEYRSQCWSVAIGYIDENDEVSYHLMIHLMHLGGIKNNIR
ncbi:MAG: LPS-assembly protein LptD [Desulfobacterales bacterium]|nr:LPS-assembly protein LptD [Desulfobacterales bacterium]